MLAMVTIYNNVQTHHIWIMSLWVIYLDGTDSYKGIEDILVTCVCTIVDQIQQLELNFSEVVVTL